ncbi:MAG: HEAT repeat domain-containing protein [Planctomycetota bacterium]
MENDTHQLLQTLRDGDISTRCRSAKALAESPFSDVSAGLIQALSDENYLVRGEAARALGMLRPTEATSHLKRALVDSHPFVRREAARALAMLYSANDAADLLKREIVDLKPLVRLEAARALGILRSADATDPLRTALVDMEPLVRAQAADALTKLEWRPSNPSEWAKFLFATGLDWQHLKMTEEVKKEVITLLLGLPEAEQRINLLLGVPGTNVQIDLLRRHISKWGLNSTIQELCAKTDWVPALIGLFRHFGKQEINEAVQVLCEIQSNNPYGVLTELTTNAYGVLTELFGDILRSSYGISCESFSDVIKVFRMMANRLRRINNTWEGLGGRLLSNFSSMVRVIEDGLSSPQSVSFLPSDIQFLATIEDAGYMGPDGFPGPRPIECMYSLKEIRNRAANVLAKRL